jgi:hypothetical protein
VVATPRGSRVSTRGVPRAALALRGSASSRSRDRSLIPRERCSTPAAVDMSPPLPAPVSAPGSSCSTSSPHPRAARAARMSQREVLMRGRGSSGCFGPEPRAARRACGGPRPLLQRRRRATARRGGAQRPSSAVRFGEGGSGRRGSHSWARGSTSTTSSPRCGARTARSRRPAEYLGVDVRSVRAALAYYADFGDEVDRHRSDPLALTGGDDPSPAGPGRRGRGLGQLHGRQ